MSDERAAITLAFYIVVGALVVVGVVLFLWLWMGRQRLAGSLLTPEDEAALRQVCSRLPK